MEGEEAAAVKPKIKEGKEVGNINKRVLMTAILHYKYDI